MSSTTYLSKYVHTVIVEYGHNFNSCIDNYLSHNLTYNWQRIGEEFGTITGELLKITLTFIYLVVSHTECLSYRRTPPRDQAQATKPFARINQLVLKTSI